MTTNVKLDSTWSTKNANHAVILPLTVTSVLMLVNVPLVPPERRLMVTTLVSMTLISATLDVTLDNVPRKENVMMVNVNKSTSLRLMTRLVSLVKTTILTVLPVL